MKQTPIHDMHNPDLLRAIPTSAQHLIEVGCSSGALAREYKKLVPDCDYLGVEIEQAYVALAQRHCDQCILADLEQADDMFWQAQSQRDCWIFGDTLEHFRDPWRILSRIRSVIPDHGCVVACVPNVQHWSMQAKLSLGAWDYQPSGLLDQTHLRWFSRTTLLKLFSQNGFLVEHLQPRIFNEPNRDHFLPMIAQMAKAAGGDPQQAKTDALPLQYVVRARPVRP